MQISGDDGVVAAFADLGVKRKILIHINNSNPVLNENSEARKWVEDLGWEVAFDGMEIEL